MHATVAVVQYTRRLIIYDFSIFVAFPSAVVFFEWWAPVKHQVTLAHVQVWWFARDIILMFLINMADKICIYLYLGGKRQTEFIQMDKRNWFSIWEERGSETSISADSIDCSCSLTCMRILAKPKKITTWIPSNRRWMLEVEYSIAANSICLQTRTVTCSRDMLSTTCLTKQMFTTKKTCKCQ